MWFWIAGGVVVVAVVALVLITGAVRRDMAELRRVADLAVERNERAQQRLLARSEQVQATVANVQARVEATYDRFNTPDRRMHRGSTHGTA